MNSLVTGIESTRYIITRKDWSDFLYLLAGGRPGRVPRRPSRRLARAAPAMTSESLVRKSTWISQKPRLDAKHWKLSDGSGLQPDWEIGHSRSRALWLTQWLALPGVQWLRVCQATTLHGPAADSGSPVPWPWSVIYLRTWVTVEHPVGLLGKLQTGSLDASWAEAKFGNTSLKFSKVLVRFMVSKPPASGLKIIWIPCVVANHTA